MAARKSKILVVDDEKDIRDVVVDILTEENYVVETAHDADSARTAVRMSTFDAVLLDIWMPGDDGVSVLKQWGEESFATPVIIMSGHGTTDTVVEATKYGAFDYIEKPLSMQRLLISIRNAVTNRDSGVETKRSKPAKSRIVGSSAAVKLLQKQIKEVAALSGNVMILGAPGTGKKTVAKMIHEQAGHPPGSLEMIDLPGGVGINDALRRMKKLGASGMILLPDIHAYTSQCQLRLLSLLNRVDEHVRQHEDKPVARLAVTAGSGITTAIRGAYFRVDLFHRLRHSVIAVPALSERPQDIPELVGYFADQFSREDSLPYRRFSTAALNRLRNHAWTGNITELQTVLRQTLARSADEVIETHDFEPYLLDIETPEFQPPPIDEAELKQFDMPIREAREQFERDYLIYNLRTSATYKEMQERTGMDRTNLYRKLKKYEIDLSPGASEAKES